MASVVLCVLLGACGARGPQGPAWPKRAATDEDGGESLAPRHPAAIAETSTPEPEEQESPADADATEADATEADATEPTDESTEPDLSSDSIAAPGEVLELDDVEIEDDDEGE